MDDLLSEFLTETSENLAVLDVELVKLERNPNDMELLGNIFRLVHTVKGTCGFLGLPRLESVAHAGENILGKLRDGELVASVEAITAVLECLDRIRSIMSDLEANGSEPEGEDSALIQRLNHIAEGGAAPVAAKPAPAPTPAAPKSQPKAAAVATKSATQSIYEQIGGMGTIDAVVEVMFSRVMGDLRIKHLFDGVNMDRLQGRMREYLSLVCGGPNTFGKVDLKCPHASAVGKGMNDTHFDAFAGHMQAALNALEVPAHLAAMIMAIVFASRDEIMGRAESGSSPVNAAAHAAALPAGEAAHAPEAEPAPAPSKAAAAAAMAAPPAKSEATETKDSAVANQSIRVNVELLENLMTMVSELVLTRNQVLQILRKQKDSEFAGPLQRLNHVTSELQEGVMKTRMQPIGNAWSKLPRLVRDLSHELKKKIELVMIGAGHRAGSPGPRDDQGPADPHGAQLRRPRPGRSGGAAPQRQAGDRQGHAQRLSRRRPHHHRGQRRRQRPRDRQDQGEDPAERPGQRVRAGADERAADPAVSCSRPASPPPPR